MFAYNRNRKTAKEVFPSNAKKYKCPSCGAWLEFDSTLQKMKCPFCDSVFPVEDFLQPQDQDHAEAYPSDTALPFSMYHCTSCGAELFADESTAAMSCPYCSSPVVLTGKVAGELMPDLIIPFQLDKEAAKAALRRHFKDKKLLPKVFSSENHLDEVKGIYVPFWLFDITADATASYRAEKVRMWSDSDFQYTETSDYEILREGTIRFEDVPADSARKMEDDLMESLEVFDLSSARPFDPVFFSGYFADRYDVSREECLERVRKRIENSAMDALEDTVKGYSSVRQKDGGIRLTDTSVKYAMFPVWILNTTWRGKQYRFAMNGETGKFVGDLPVDPWITWKWRILYMLGFGGVLYAALAFLGFL